MIPNPMVAKALLNQSRARAGLAVLQDADTDAGRDDVADPLVAIRATRLFPRNENGPAAVRQTGPLVGLSHPLNSRIFVLGTQFRVLRRI